MLRMTTALLLLSPAIASAQCLTADAIDAGITIEYGSRSTSYIQRTDYGTIIDAYYDRLDYEYYGSIVLFETIDGVFMARRDQHKKDSWEAFDDDGFDYDFDTDIARPYTPDTRGSGVITVLDARYGPEDASFGWSVYASEPLVVGDCSYEAVNVFTTEFSVQNGEIYIRAVKYLPELGFGIQTGNSYFGLSAGNGDIVSMSAS